MSEEFDPLRILMTLLQPGRTPGEQFDLLSRLDDPQWQALLGEADRQGVTPFLYPLLSDLEKSTGLTIPGREDLRLAHLSTAARNLVIMHEAEQLLTALESAGVRAAGLKGVYLADHVYENIGARSMNDIDILVKKPDLAASLRVMQNLGLRLSTYFELDDPNTDTKHIPPMQKPGSPPVELHWSLLEEHEPFTTDADGLWERTVPARIANVDALALGVEDLVLHLCLHLTYQHYLNLGLRGLLDIALVIHKFRAEIDWQLLADIAKTWGAGRVTALTLQLVETQLNVPIPAEVYQSLLPGGVAPDILSQARAQLLEQKLTEDNFTPDLVELAAERGFFSKLKRGWQRVFIPRMAIARIYNVPPNSPKVVCYYFTRMRYLLKTYGKTLLRLRIGKTATESARKAAETSTALHAWMAARDR